jgi:hypothetical protein
MRSLVMYIVNYANYDSENYDSIDSKINSFIRITYLWGTDKNISSKQGIFDRLNYPISERETFVDLLYLSIR